MTYCKMPVSKLLSLLLLVSFMLILTGPIFTLLSSKYEPVSVLTAMEKEAENKDLQDNREFSELDFDNNILLGVHFFAPVSSLTYGFSNQLFKPLDIKKKFPPPDFV